MTTIWVDVEDMFQYAQNHTRPSGIQRLAYEICCALVAGDTTPGRTRFVRHGGSAQTFHEVAWGSLSHLFDAMAEAPALLAAEPARPPRPPRPRSKLRRVAGSQWWALQEFGALLCSIVAAVRRRRRAGPVELTALARPGDVLLAIGSPWLPGYAERIARIQRRHGMRFAMLVYDIIPLRHPEWCSASLVADFKTWMDSVLPLADTVLAISRATAADVERYAAANAIALRRAVRPIPIGTGFQAPPMRVGTARPDLPEPGSYVLFVSTIEPRKNHELLFRVWRHLLEQMSRAEVPMLVFAGRAGWLVGDFMQQLENANYLDGKIRFVQHPTDAELEALYRGCRFTVFPSYYEGWGLPVTESLSFGKPCVISNATSLPEAGGALARYFDPENVAEATRVIRATIEDRAGLAEWQERVVREFRPVSWDATADALIAVVAPG